MNTEKPSQKTVEKRSVAQKSASPEQLAKKLQGQAVLDAQLQAQQAEEKKDAQGSNEPREETQASQDQSAAGATAAADQQQGSQEGVVVEKAGGGSGTTSDDGGISAGWIIGGLLVAGGIAAAASGGGDDDDTTPPAAPTGLDLAAADDTGTKADDNITKLTTGLTISGTAEAGSTVKILDGSTQVGSTTASSSGTFSVDVNLAAGSHSVTATATDAAGNVSTASSALSITVDTTAPTTPGVGLSKDTGSSSADKITSDGTLVLTSLGTGDTRTYSLNGGAATSSPPTAYVQGKNTVVVTDTDVAGNASSTTFEFTYDTAAPAAPTGLDLAAADDTKGTSTGTDSDNLTKLTSGLTIAGAAEAGSTVAIFDGATQVATATAGTAGTFSVDVALGAGSHSLTAKATDVAGNVGAASSALTITVDTSTATPSAPNLIDGDDTGTSNTDDLTNKANVTINGTAEANSTVEIFRGTTSLGTAVTDGTGAWSKVVTLAAGANSLTAVSTDAAGNVSVASAATVVTLDQVAPNLGDVTGAATYGMNELVGNNDATFNITFASGVAAGDTVHWAVTTGSPAQNVGSGTYTVTATDVTNGFATVPFTVPSVVNLTTYELSAHISDAAGNEGSNDFFGFTSFDNLAANPPTIDLLNSTDTGRSDTDNVTQADPFTITGTGEYSTGGSGTAHVDLYRWYDDGDGIIESGELWGEGSATIGTTGAWSFSMGWASEGVNKYVATQTDTYGNTSQLSSVLTVTVDTISPTAGAIDLNAADDSFGPAGTTGTNSDNVTNVTSGLTIDITGAEPNNYVWVYDWKDDDLDGIADAAELTAARLLNATPGVVGTLGTASVDVALTPGQHTLVATFEDVAGNGTASDNVPSISGFLSINVDTISVTPTLDLNAGSDSGVSSTDNVTAVTSGLVFDGTGEVGSLITLYDGATAIATTTVGITGTWTTTVNLANGVHSLTATATDAAGNVSAPAALTVTVDNTQPQASAPDLAAIDDTGISNTDNITKLTTGLTLEGTAPASSTVKIYEWADADTDGVIDAGELTQIATASASTTGTYSIDVALAEGTHKVLATSTNTTTLVESPYSAATTIVVDTTKTGPGVLDLVTASDTSGPQNPAVNPTSDNLTNDSTPTHTVTQAEGARAFVYLYNDANANGVFDAGDTVTTTLVGQGTITAGVATITPTLADGSYNVVAVVEDAAGNVSDPSNGFKLTVDTVAPVGTPTAPDLAAASDTYGNPPGATDDNITATTNGLVFSGSFVDPDGAGPLPVPSGEAGATVYIYATGGSYLTPTIIGKGTLAGDTTYSVTTTTALADGSYNVYAQVYDDAGNAGPSSATTSIRIDTTVAAPTTLDLAAIDDNGYSNVDNITNVSSGLTFTGVGEVGALVTLREGANVIGTGTVGADGKWTIDAALGVAAATTVYSVSATQTDLAGNISAASSALSVTVDLVAPAAVTVTGLNTSDDTGASAADFITKNNKNLTIDGTGSEAGATISIYKWVDAPQGVTPADGVVQANELTLLAQGADTDGGAWAVDILNLADGSYQLVATQTDIAGNTGPYSAVPGPVLVVDTVVAAPTIDLTAASDLGVSSTDNLTADNTPTFTGVAEAGAAVTLYDTDGTTVLGTGTADGAGAWTITSSALSNGVHNVQAKQVDLAGNASTASSLAVTIDATAPVGSFAVTAAAAPSSGLYNVTLALTANEGITSTVIGAATYTTTTFTHAFSGNNDPVNATITDLAGAQSVVDNVRVVIDGSLGDGSVGTENAGTSKIDVVYAQDNASTSIGGIGAADWALGGNAADTFTVSALGFSRIDGNVNTSNDSNTNVDTLNLAALTNTTINIDNITLDLRAEQIFDIELFNIEDGEAGDNFYLNLATVQNNNVAVIDADAGDFVRFTENTVTAGAAQANSWVWDGTTTQTIGSETFRLYTYYDGTTTATTTQIWIENGVTVTTLGG